MAAGFDTGSYPGDALMQAWAGGNSPYQWCGYYLDAPCHSSKYTSWMGKYPFLTALGWGLAIVYVGRQQTGCGSTELSLNQGLADGQDTVNKCATEGFPNGTIVFLDVEHFDGAITAEMTAYYQGWLSAVLDSGTIQPGTYCAAVNANDLQNAAQQEYGSRGLTGAPAFWIVRVKASLGFNPATSAPTGCGVSFANVWQGNLDIPNETHNGFGTNIDQNAADSADPSHVLAAAGTGG